MIPSAYQNMLLLKHDTNDEIIIHVLRAYAR